jgi:hypothetical protein
MLFVSFLVVLCGCYPDMFNPNLTNAAFPFARAQGCVHSCVLTHVSYAGMSPPAG